MNKQLILFCAVAIEAVVLYVAYLVTHPDNKEQPTKEEQNTVTCRESFCGLPSTPVMTPKEQRIVDFGNKHYGPKCYSACAALDGEFVQYDHSQPQEQRCLCVNSDTASFFWAHGYEKEDRVLRWTQVPE